MMTFEILKKNRKYFAATKKGSKCKILIDSNSEDLVIGTTYELEVEDISVRSKYGTDLIYKLSANTQEQASAGICTLRHDRFNSLLVDQARAHNGKWDPDQKAWVFSGLIAEIVEELDEIYNSPLINVEVTFDEDYYAHTSSIEFIGYPIAAATGRDSGASQKEGHVVVAGGFTSGGSAKNWKTVVTQETTIRMPVPKLLLERELPNMSELITVKRI